MDEAKELENIKHQIEAGNLIYLEAKAHDTPRIKHLKRRLKQGEGFEEAALAVGFKSANKAKSALVAGSRMGQVRDFLVELNLGNKRLAEELEWGINAAKGTVDLAAHTRYLHLLKEILDKAHRGSGDGAGSTEEFINYLKGNLSEGDAAVVLRTINGFKKSRDGSL